MEARRVVAVEMTVAMQMTCGWLVYSCRWTEEDTMPQLHSHQAHAAKTLGAVRPTIWKQGNSRCYSSTAGARFGAC